MSLCVCVHVHVYVSGYLYHLRSQRICFENCFFNHLTCRTHIKTSSSCLGKPWTLWMQISLLVLSHYYTAFANMGQYPCSHIEA